MSTREISKITAAVAFASRGLLLAISVLLLTSLGGAAIYAAPVTLPLLFLVANAQS